MSGHKYALKARTQVLLSLNPPEAWTQDLLLTRVGGLSILLPTSHGYPLSPPSLLIAES